MDGRWQGPAFEPPHPGEYLREDILPELGLTVEQFAARLGYGRGQISDLLHGRRDLNQEMAIRLGQAFKNGARFWLALQMQRDLWLQERDEEARAERPPIEPFEWDDGDVA